MPSVNIENIGIVNFPDSMSLQDIQRAIRDDIIPNFQRQQPVAQTEPVAPQQAPVPEGSGSSFARGIDEMQGGLYSAVEGLGRATGFQGVERFGREGRVRNIQEAEASLPSSQQMSFERASGVGENIRAAGQALGGSLPSSALPMGGALAGAAMGAPLGPVGAGIGAILGGAAGAFPGLYGSNRARQIETSGEVQSEGRAAAAAIPQALAEGVVDRITLGLGRILGVGGDVVGRELLPRIARGVGVGAVSEVPSEVFQQAMERAQAGLDVLSPEAMAEYREAATAAAVVGGTMGGTFAGALGPRPQPTEQDRQQAELRGAIEEVVGAREPVPEEVAAGAPVQEQEITPERISQAIERAQERLDALTGTLNNARVRLAEATTGDDVDPAQVNAIKREIKDISGQVREQKSNISALNRILPRPSAAGELFKVRAGAAPAAAPVVEPAPIAPAVEPVGEPTAAIPPAPPVAPIEAAPLAEETVAPTPAGPRVTGFTTAQGSTYQVNDQGQTIRTKRSPGRGQGTTYEPLNALYVDPAEAANILEELRDGGNYRFVVEDGDGQPRVIEAGESLSGRKSALALFSRTGEFVRYVPTQGQPAVGLSPVELLYSTDPDGNRISKKHIGNPIVSLQAADAAAPAAEQGRDTELSARRVGVQPQAETEVAAEQADAGQDKSLAIIQKFLADLRAKGPQGKSLADALEEALADRRFNANQIYAAFTIDNAILKSMPKGADYKFKFVDDLVATDADAARASGANVGDRVQGRLNPATESIPAFIEISLAEDMLPILRETAAHEAFHVLQNYFGAYDRGFNALLAKSFKQDMTIDQLDPSIKRRLQGLKAPGLDQSYFAVLKSGLGDNPLSVREAQAYAFGALTDAAMRGQKVTGLTAPFQRYVNFLRDTFTRLRSGLRGDGYQTAADLLAGAGARAEGFTQEAPQTGGQEYSGRNLPESLRGAAEQKIAPENSLKRTLQMADAEILSEKSTALLARQSSPEGLEYGRKLQEARDIWSKVDSNRNYARYLEEQLREPGITDQGIFKIQRRLANARNKFDEGAKQALSRGVDVNKPFPSDDRYELPVGQFPGDERYLYKSYAPEGYPFHNREHDFSDPRNKVVQGAEFSARGIPQQKISSAKTSIAQIPATFKRVDFKPGTRNLDYGGGSYDLGSEFLREKGVENFVYDRFNRSEEHNDSVLKEVGKRGADTVTVNNVLNVVAEPEVRDFIVEDAANYLKPGGTAYFLVYEGDGTGIGKETSKGFQNNAKTESYLPAIKRHFNDVMRKGNLIIARGVKGGVEYSARRPPGAAARAAGNVAGLPQFGQRVPASTPASVNAADLQVQYDILPRYISNKLGRFVEKPKVERFFAVMQDKMLPAGRMIDDIKKAGGSVPVAMDAYLKEDLLQGKVADMLEKRNKNLYGKLTETLSKSGISLQDFENYLYARHAKERNDYIASINPNMPDGGSGLTNQQAKEFMDEFQQQGKLTKMQGLARLFDNIIADTNKLRVDSGLTPDFSRVTRAEDGRPLPNYQNYAPLRGFADESVDADETVQEFRPKTGKALGARGREDKRALGRERKAGDIIAHAIMQNTQAVIRSESNKVGQAFLEMIRSNPNQSKDLAEVVAKAPLKKTIVNGVVKLVPDINYKNAPDILVVKEGGKEVAIRIYDENVARAMNGASSLSPASKNMLVQGMAILNRYLAKINTAYNPEFLITNLVRDLQTFGVNVQQYNLDGIAKDSLRDLKPALSGVRDSVRGTNNNPQMKRSYERFKELGGTTEMYGFTNIESQIEEVNKVMASVGTQAKSWKDMAKAVTPVIKLIEDYNTIVENGIRTSLFKNLVDRGINEERAAQLAKNVTVNFSKGGEQRVLMNSLYLFYNASLQGTMAMVNALGRSPKVRKIVAGVVVAGVLQDVMNSMLSDVDDDEKKLYDKIPDYILKNRFVMMDPFNLTERGYFSFPMPYGFNAFFNMGREMSKASRGESSPMKAAGNILGTFVDSFNPIGGSENFFNFMAPTILDPAVDVIRNRDFSGRPIVPERGSFGVQAPESQKYWNNTFAPYVGISNFLNSLTGGTPVIPGAVDISPNMIQYVVNYATGGVGKFAERTFNTATTTIPGALRGDLEELDVKGVPFLRSLYGSVTTREDMTTYMERMEEVLRIRKEISDASQSGQPERITAALERYPGQVQIMDSFNRLARDRSQISQRINEISRNVNIPEDSKKDIIKSLRDQQNALMVLANRLYIQNVEKR